MLNAPRLPLICATSPEHRNLIYPLYHRTFQHSGARLWSINELNTMLTQPHIHAFLYQDNTPYPTSFLIASIFENDCEILTLGTAPEHQQQRHASMLLANFIRHAQQQTINHFFLEVDEANHAAQKLYQKIGFSHISTRKNYYQNGNAAFIYSHKNDTITH